MTERGDSSQLEELLRYRLCPVNQRTFFKCGIVEEKNTGLDK